MKRLIVIAMVVLLSSSIALAQNFCKGDFNYDGAVAADDVATFLEHFGRSPFNDPCPPDGPAPVPKTWQTTSYGTGDDGDLGKGVAWPDPRWTDNGDGTVKDKLTGLIWLKNANCFGGRTWNNARVDCNGLSSGWCGLTDGSSAGDWRLPNVRELQSHIDYDVLNPAIWVTHPYVNVQSSSYWSSSTVAESSALAWVVHIDDGVVFWGNKSSDLLYVWPVRGGH
jgi:hypothetical protein